MYSIQNALRHEKYQDQINIIIPTFLKIDIYVNN